MCSKVIPLYIYREGDPHSFEDSIGTVLGGDLLQLHRRLLPSIPVPPGVRILLPPMWLQPQAPPPLRCPPDPCGQMGWGCERSRPRGSKRDRESCEGQVLLPPALFDPPPNSPEVAKAPTLGKLLPFWGQWNQGRVTLPPRDTEPCSTASARPSKHRADGRASNSAPRKSSMSPPG